MQFYFTDKNRVDTAAMPLSAEVDIEISRKDNSFEVVIPADEYDASKHMVGGYFYAPGTEYGGRIYSMTVSTAERTVNFTGLTWRGLLQRRLVIPPSGSDYYSFTGDLNGMIRAIVGSHYGNLFQCANNDAGASVNGFTARYGTYHDVLVSACDSVGYRLDIKADNSQEALVVTVGAVPVADYAEDVEVSQDSNVQFEIAKNAAEYNYMVCGGKGELKNRLVRILHRIDRKHFEVVDSIPDGIGALVMFFDYPNAETEAELIKSAKEKFSEVISGSTQKVTINSESADYEIGDIVGGRDYITGTYVSEPITSKIVNIDAGGKLRIQYEVGD